MLVLTRKEGQGICCGDGIVIKIVSIHGKQVRLGLMAGPEIRIRRSELAPVPVAVDECNVDDTELED